MRTLLALLASAVLSACASLPKPATVLPDTLVCATTVPIGQLTQNTKAATALPATDVLRSTKATLAAISQSELGRTVIAPPTIDANVQRLIDQGRSANAAHMASVLLDYCDSSGPDAVAVTLLERIPGLGLVKVSMPFRGALQTIYLERGQVTE